MKSIFEYFQFKYRYFISCFEAWCIKESIRNIDARYSLQLSNKQIDKLTEMYIQYTQVKRNTTDTIEDFVFFKMYHV